MLNLQGLIGKTRIFPKLRLHRSRCLSPDDSEQRDELNVGMPERGDCGGRLASIGKDCPPWNLFQSADANNESFGLFGEIGIDLGERFILTLGARYSDESRDYSFDVDGWGDSGGLNGIGLGDATRDCADPANRFDDPDACEFGVA